MAEEETEFKNFLNSHKFYQQQPATNWVSIFKTVLAIVAIIFGSAFLVWAVAMTVLYVQKNVMVDPEQPLAEPYMLDIITFNDCYEISPVTVTVGEMQEKRGGASRVAAYIKNVRKTNPRTLALAGGDFVSPSLGSTLFRGEQMVAALNAMSLNYTCYGNHDFGTDVLEQRVLESTNFKWLSANILDRTTGSKTVYPQALENVLIDMMPAAKVGIFGLVYDLFSTSLKINSTRYAYVNARSTAIQQIANLQARGATYIIALTHMTANENCDLASVPGLNMIVSGHDHNAKSSSDCGGATYYTATQDWQNIWHLKLNFSNPTVPSVSASSVTITMNMPTDPQVEQVIVKFDGKMQAEFEQTIGTTTTSLDARSSLIRQQETGLANFVTDTIRAFTNTDVAVVNGGGIRGNRIVLPGNIKKGDIFSWFPFGNVIGAVYVNGSTLCSLIESSLARYELVGGSFLQVSNIKYVFDAARPIGNRLLSCTFFNGTAIPPSQRLTLSTSDYIINGGDGVTDLKDKNLGAIIDPREGEVLTSVIFERIKALKTISPQIEGRIVKL